MRKVREVLRLRNEGGRSHAEIAASAGIGELTVGDYLARARRAGLAWPEASAMSDGEVRLFRDTVGRNEPPARVPIDFAWVHRELSRVGVTLQTPRVEYREGAIAAAPLRPYEYNRCNLYAQCSSVSAVAI